jgi:hypothetical protein
MPSTDGAVPLGQVVAPKLGELLPRGLLSPPALVRERIEQERFKHPPEIFARNPALDINLASVNTARMESRCLVGEIPKTRRWLEGVRHAEATDYYRLQGVENIRGRTDCRQA